MAHDAFGLCALRPLVLPCASSRFWVNRRRPMPAGDVYHPLRAQRGLTFIPTCRGRYSPSPGHRAHMTTVDHSEFVEQIHYLIGLG